MKSLLATLILFASLSIGLCQGTFHQSTVQGRLKLFSNSLSNTTSYATMIQMGANSVEIPTRSILHLSGRLIAANGGDSNVVVTLGTSLDGSNWKTNLTTVTVALDGTNSVYFQSAVVGGTNIPARFISCTALSTPQTNTATVTYINYLFLPAL